MSAYIYIYIYKSTKIIIIKVPSTARKIVPLKVLAHYEATLYFNRSELTCT